MASLKEKSSKSKSSNGSLKSKAKQSKLRPKDDGAIAAIPSAESPGMANISAGMQFNAPPPLPPEFDYLSKYAQIPGLRRKSQGVL